jgi:hypothetical protein
MVNCFQGIATILRALRLKKCHSSCCDIEIEVASPPVTPATKNTTKEFTYDNTTSSALGDDASMVSTKIG